MTYVLQNDLREQVAAASYMLINKRFEDSLEDVKYLITQIGTQKNSVKVIIADALYGLNKASWDQTDHMWKKAEFQKVIKFSEV